MTVQTSTSMGINQSCRRQATPTPTAPATPIVDLFSDREVQNFQRTLMTIAMAMAMKEELRLAHQAANSARDDLELLIRSSMPHLLPKLPTKLIFIELDLQADVMKSDMYGSWAYAQTSINLQNKNALTEFNEAITSAAALLHPVGSTLLRLVH